MYNRNSKLIKSLKSICHDKLELVVIKDLYTVDTQENVINLLVTEEFNTKDFMRLQANLIVIANRFTGVNAKGMVNGSYLVLDKILFNSLPEVNDSCFLFKFKNNKSLIGFFESCCGYE